MVEIASRSQLRMSFLRWALFTVPLILLLGWFGGNLATSGEENRWFAALDKPDIFPPGWMFGVVWTILYILMGLALAMVLNARGARGRTLAVILFAVALLGNLTWTPLFFGMHQVGAALWLIIFIFLIAFVATILFARIRKAAGWLMVPYLAWLVVAALLNWQIDVMNPDAETLVVPAATSQIEIP
jgi:tryptophan-rich sensory protein